MAWFLLKLSPSTFQVSTLTISLAGPSASHRLFCIPHFRLTNSIIVWIYTYHAKKLVLKSQITGERATGTGLAEVSADLSSLRLQLCSVTLPFPSKAELSVTAKCLLYWINRVLYIYIYLLLLLYLISLGTIEFFFLLTPQKDISFLFIPFQCYLKVLTQPHHQRELCNLITSCSKPSCSKQ